MLQFNMDFESILFGLSTPPQVLSEEEDFLVDLNIAPIVEAIAAEKRDLPVSQFFYMQIDNPGILKYRYEVFHDILDHSVRDILNSFSRHFLSMKKQIDENQVAPHPLQKEAIHLNSALYYIHIIENITSCLKKKSLKSVGLTGFVKYLESYRQSEDFLNLKNDGLKAKEELEKVRIHLTIGTESVKVSRGDRSDFSDYTDEISQLFSEFRDNDIDLVSEDCLEIPEADKPQSCCDGKCSDEFGSGKILSTVEYSMIQSVAKIYSPEFYFLNDFWESYPEFLAPKMERFFLELQFYLGYFDFMKNLGTGFCFPTISTDIKQEKVVDCYDLSLAVSLANHSDSDYIEDESEGMAGAQIVKNDYYLTPKEKILFITGPNRSGKTTFLKMMGQIHYLMKLGVPIPAKGAVLFLPDNIFTHFERSESLVSYNGKLKDDLERIHSTLEQATERSLILINEIFISTTIVDAIDLSKKIFAQIIDRGILAANVGFLYELKDLDPALVSMSVLVDKANPFLRTYKIIRKDAEKQAYAELLVKAFHLTPENIEARIKGRILKGESK